MNQATLMDQLLKKKFPTAALLLTLSFTTRQKRVNYFVSKILEKCNKDRRLQLLPLLGTFLTRVLLQLGSENEQFNKNVLFNQILQRNKNIHKSLLTFCLFCSHLVSLLRHVPVSSLLYGPTHSYLIAKQNLTCTQT